MEQPTTNEAAAPRGHHPDSASGLQPAEWCERYRPDTGETEASLAGTACHKACETGDLTGLNEEQIGAVTTCNDFVAKLKEELTVKWGDSPICLTEAYYPIDNEKSLQPSEFTGTTGGINDLALISGDYKKAVVIDYKFVTWEVEDAENNIQGIVYLLGLRHKFRQLEEVEVYFLMPYLQTVSYARFTKDDFARLYLRVKRLVHRRYAEDAVERPSWDTCSFCKRITSCKAIAAEVITLGKKYDDLHWPPTADITMLTEGSAESKARLKCADIMASWAKATRAVVTEQVVSGDTPIPDGYTLANQSDRTVVDATGLVHGVADKIGVHPETVWAATTPSIGAIEKLIEAKAPHGMKTALSKQILETFETAKFIGRAAPKIFLRAKRDREQE